jgi:flagellar hook-associated protein 1 FlgK
MSISSTMSSALSGLTASARSAELISSNIANALTEGYVRRELDVSARRVGDSGQGVQVNGVKRIVDHVLLSDRRIAGADEAGRNTTTEFLQRLEQVLGSPENADSPVGRVAALDTALIATASQPQSEARLNSLADAAQNLTDTFRRTTSEIQTARSIADTQIIADVKEINRSLAAISDLNGEIVSVTSGGRDTSALQDLRQQLIDRISTIVPLRELQREDGRVALYTQGGAALLDGRPVELGYTSVGVITADMTLASGALSGLTINGSPVRTDAGGPMAGGSLAAQFAIRDELAPAAPADLDAVALDFISRFADPSVDPSLAAGDAGLFTDRGAAFTAGNELGLAGRISINSAVDPTNGGALWRLRDGINATTPGAVGQSSLLNAMETALTDPRMTGSGSFSPANRSFSDFAAQMTSHIATDRLDAQTEASFATARFTALRSLELEEGVDTDRELQDLLLIEQAYKANAKVVQTVDEMIQLLLGM